MTRLESWLKQATRYLAQDSAAQVRAEIQEHYDSAREAAISAGATADQADQQAVSALGNAGTANCQYRKVLLTSAEARMLRQGITDGRASCARRWLKQALFALPLAAVIGAAVFFLLGAAGIARILLVSGL